MTVQDIYDFGFTDVVTFKEPSYDGCIIGVSHDGRAIYSASKMLDYLCRTKNLSEEDARDFLDYETIRSLSYTPDGPIVMELEEIDIQEE